MGSSGESSKRSRRTAQRIIETYRRDVSHRLGTHCAFDVSCSHYAHDAFGHHALPVATAMTARRILQCSRATRYSQRSSRTDRSRGAEGVRGARGVHRGLRVVAATFVFAAAVLTFPLLGALGPGASSADAATKGGGAAGCAATLDGADAYAASTPDRAIVVSKDANVRAAGAMASGPVTYSVDMEFSGVSWNVAKGTGSSTEATWSNTVNIADYAKYGVGIYRVDVTSTNPAGQRCNLHAFVKVDASPLSTPVGKGAVALLAVGAAAVAVPTALAFSQDATPAGASLLDEPLPDPKDPKAAERRFNNTHGALAGCGYYTVAAVFLTAAAIARSKGVA